ncbi:MAG: class I tRNA ligase family protein, partial [Bacteroidota bacterium]|nr:class I tRNA ligase family protein [Bacteroidota bacterium]
RNVDLYIGGDEHATGHLIYSRFWNKFLFDIGLACEDEPFKKLINQGKIQGRSNFVYRINGTNKFVSAGLKKEYNTAALHVDINLVDNDYLDIEGFKNWRPEFKNTEFILEDGKYLCGWEVEKMSKSKHNVQNPDALIERYGADTLRLYEMFLGPLEQSKPWDTNGIEGVSRFLKKFWRLFVAEDGSLKLKISPPTEAENKILYRTIDKVKGDIERFSFNTAVSSFMICVNELTDIKSSNREIHEKLLITLSPFAPHLSEELWSHLGHNSSISQSSFPKIEQHYLKDDSIEYPVSFNGKMRFKLEFPVDLDKKSIEEAVLTEEKTKKWLEGKQIVKVIVVPGKIVNIVIR